MFVYSIPFLFLVVSQCLAINWGWLKIGNFGADTPLAVFKGQITQNGKPVSASLSLDVMYKSNGHTVPVTLVQTNTLFNYDLRVSGIAFRDPNITTSAILRAQALSVYGGSATVEFEMENDKIQYLNDIELTAPHKKHHHDEDDDDDEEEERPRHHKKHHKRRSHKHHEKESDDDDE